MQLYSRRRRRPDDALQAPQSASRSPTPEAALHRQGRTPPTPAQLQNHFLSHRVVLDSNGAIAIGLPLTGGILIKYVNAVDLEHLRASRKASTARPNPNIPSEEDEWCTKLRSLAPGWYRSISDRYQTLNDDRPKTTTEEEQASIGYLDSPRSGHVVVVRCVTGQMPAEWGAYNKCLTMQERCDVMEEFGADVYGTADEAEELNGRHEEKMKRERDKLEDEYGPFEA
ncbi:MAG: hypothetical protein Q9157_000504 [Trypethelium eluteriae]